MISGCFKINDHCVDHFFLGAAFSLAAFSAAWRSNSFCAITSRSCCNHKMTGGGTNGRLVERCTEMIKLGIMMCSGGGQVMARVQHAPAGREMKTRIVKTEIWALISRYEGMS